MNRLLKAALAGLIATGPMTLVMVGIKKLLPWWQQSPIPPSQITSETTEELNLQVSQSQHRLLTALAHLGYGTGVALLYAPLATVWRIPGTVKGILFGLAVWFFSYLGWLPALGILRPADEWPQGRNIMMIVSHIVWGGVTGWLFGKWQD